MKTTLSYLIVLVLLAFVGNSQDVTTVEAKNYDISANLDLQAVATVFGESNDLQDFEKRLNDPDKHISNLDLNNDGVVDYLRVIEVSKDNTHVVTIQAVIGEDQFQDVATIDVVKDNSDNTTVQVVGDVYMYGPDYIVQPVYVHQPVIYTYFWGPMYSPWYSPYYYGYYPPYYDPWAPYPTYYYTTNVYVNYNNSYRYPTERYSRASVELENRNRRNDFGKKYPDRSYNERTNSQGNARSNIHTGNNDATNRPNQNATGRKVQKDWKPEEGLDRNTNMEKTRVVTSPQKSVNNPTENRKPANQVNTHDRPEQKPVANPVENRQPPNQRNMSNEKPVPKTVNNPSEARPPTNQSNQNVVKPVQKSMDSPTQARPASNQVNTEKPQQKSVNQHNTAKPATRNTPDPDDNTKPKKK
ncbi:MAG: hypothetical protein H8E34_02130 [Bacteroidetes bacterium]|nr:hypothetical protein [Bacteroidota bacterium]MBL6944032.1 hypothetical protein [Bacteroidales bacterium]